MTAKLSWSFDDLEEALDFRNLPSGSVVEGWHSGAPCELMRITADINSVPQIHRGNLGIGCEGRSLCIFSPRAKQ